MEEIVIRNMFYAKYYPHHFLATDGKFLKLNLVIHKCFYGKYYYSKYTVLKILSAKFFVIMWKFYLIEVLLSTNFLWKILLYTTYSVENIIHIIFWQYMTKFSN